MERLRACIITAVFPRLYVKRWYAKNTGVHSWNGKKACMTLSFDCDYSKDVLSLPLILRILKQRSLAASFACVGKLIERYPVEHRQILEGGHEIMNHTYTHPNHEELNPGKKFNNLSIGEKKDEIEQCHRACQTLLGYSPIGFRTPHFGNLHTDTVYGVLRETGYAYSSSIALARTERRDGLPFLRQGIREFPVSACPEHPYGVFDTWHALKRGCGRHAEKGAWEAEFRRLVNIGIETNSYLNVYFDPQDAAEEEAFPKMMEYLWEKRSEIEVATYRKMHETVYVQGK